MSLAPVFQSLLHLCVDSCTVSGTMPDALPMIGPTAVQQVNVLSSSVLFLTPDKPCQVQCPVHCLLTGPTGVQLVDAFSSSVSVFVTSPC